MRWDANAVHKAHNGLAHQECSVSLILALAEGRDPRKKRRGKGAEQRDGVKSAQYTVGAQNVFILSPRRGQKVRKERKSKEGRKQTVGTDIGRRSQCLCLVHSRCSVIAHLLARREPTNQKN